MIACLIQRALLSAGAHVNMHVAVSAAITCVCSVCTQHHHALQSKQMGRYHVMQATDCVLLALLSVNEQLTVLSKGNVPVFCIYVASHLTSNSTLAARLHFILLACCSLLLFVLLKVFLILL